MDAFSRTVLLAAQIHDDHNNRDKLDYSLELAGRLQTEKEKITAVMCHTLDYKDISMDMFNIEEFSEDIIEAITILHKKYFSPIEHVVRCLENKLSKAIVKEELKMKMDSLTIDNFDKIKETNDLLSLLA